MNPWARITFILLLLTNPLFGENMEWKPMMRSVFGKISSRLNFTPTNLASGVALVVHSNCIGLEFQPNSVEIRPIVWSADHGLLDQVKALNERGEEILAAVNGAFFQKTGIIGSVIIDGAVPNVKTFKSSISKCFFAFFKSPAGGKWVLGETSKTGPDLLKPEIFFRETVNRNLQKTDRLTHFLGGAGWIIRNSKDVHMEAYRRQKFRFRRIDQDSRHTVVAMDLRDKLYFLIFETGANLQKISEILRGPSFGNITEAIFFDGGSSSTLICQNQYLVSPLYLIDRSRFSALVAIPQK